MKHYHGKFSRDFMNLGLFWRGFFRQKIIVPLPVDYWDAFTVYSFFGTSIKTETSGPITDSFDGDVDVLLDVCPSGTAI